MGVTRLPPHVRRLIPTVETRRPKRPAAVPSAQGITARQAASGPAPGRQVLVIDGFPTPSEVRILGPNGTAAHFHALGRLRSRVQQMVGLLVKAQRIRKVPPPVRMTLRFVVGQHRNRDDDNWHLIGQPVANGLVRAEVLEADDHARLERHVEFVVEKGARRLEVILEGSTE